MQSEKRPSYHKVADEQKEKKQMFLAIDNIPQFHHTGTHFLRKGVDTLDMS